MNDLISRAEAIELKPEFLNPNVNRETKEQTAIDRAYARGWNSCNTHWIKEIIEDLPSAQPDISDISVEIEAEYKKWVNVPYINKPLAKALYEVWKKYDKEDVERGSDETDYRKK